MSSTPGTHGAPSPSISTRALTRFATMGGRQRKLAAQLDALRTRGPAIALHQRRSLRGGLASEFREGARAPPTPRSGERPRQRSVPTCDRSGTTFSCSQRDRASTVVRENLVVFNDGPGLALSGDKPLMHRMLVEKEFRVPEHIEVDWRDYTRGSTFSSSAKARAWSSLRPAPEAEPESPGAWSTLTTWPGSV